MLLNRHAIRRCRTVAAPVLAVCLALAAFACAADAPAPPAGAAEKPKVGKLPNLTFDITNKQVRVEADALEVEAPLEFFCVLTNTAEHESVLRSKAKPSDLHTALLAVGLKPGRPVSYSETLRKWSPPQGPPLQVTIEWEEKGQKKSIPSYRLMRDVKTKKSMPPLTWVFVGSRQMEDGTYAADTTGYIISVVNFDLTVIDIPQLASNANETLEWERNPDLAPPGGTKVTMIIEPAGNKPVGGAAVAPVAVASADPAPVAPVPPVRPEGSQLSDVQLDELHLKKMEEFWNRAVNPHAKALREAADAHYRVITDLRREQQRLIDEADRLQRAIDTLEKQYQDMTTPKPAGSGEAPAAAPEAPQRPARNADDPGPFGGQ